MIRNESIRNNSKITRVKKCGVHFDLKTKLENSLKAILIKQSVEDTIRIKYSCTRLKSCLNRVISVISFTILLRTTKSFDSIIGIFNIQNENSIDKPVNDLINEIKGINQIEIESQKYKFDKIFEGDSDYLSLFFETPITTQNCIWCTNSENFRFLFSIKYLLIQVSNGLFELLTTELNKFQNIQPLKNALFEIIRKISISGEDKLYSKEELNKIKALEVFMIIKLIPDKERIKKLNKVWTLFFEIENLTNQKQQSLIIQFKTKKWLQSFESTYHKDQLSLYFHVFVNHLHEFIQLDDHTHDHTNYLKDQITYSYNQRIKNLLKNYIEKQKETSNTSEKPGPSDLNKNRINNPNLLEYLSTKYPNIHFSKHQED